MSINLLCHEKFIVSATCVIIIDAPAVSCTPKQIDLQAFFVTTAALLCQQLLDVNQHNTNRLVFGTFTKYFNKTNLG